METSKLIMLAMILWSIAVIDTVKSVSNRRFKIKARVYIKGLVLSKRFENAIRSIT